MDIGAIKPPKRLSCVSCRQRKIKCDRVDPCKPCGRAGIHCVFPKPAPPRSRTKFKAKGDQIAHRLSRLEGLVNALGGEDAIEARAKGEAIPPTQPPANQSSGGLGAQRNLPRGDATNHFDPEGTNMNKLEGEKSMGNDFWANLSAEVEGLRNILDDASLETDEEEDEDLESNSSVVDERDAGPLTFPFSGDAVTDLIARYPTPAETTKMLELYFTRFDGVFKILHRPTVMEHFNSFVSTRRFTPGSSDEAIAFAIFYASITTLEAHETQSIFGEEKEPLLLRYERALEVALMNARLLTTTEFGTLQAFCIYILCRRTHYADRSAWSLTSLAVRIALAQGLNSDGQTIGLSSFETEMRRRFWWALVVLDIQGCEDRGTSQLITSHLHDVKLPVNINDEDIDPQMGYLNTGRSEFTIMSFSLITYEVAKTYEYVNAADAAGPAAAQSRGLPMPTMEEKERKVTEANKLLHQKYVQHCNQAVPLEQKASMIAQVSILKLWLLLQYPVSSRGKAIMPRSLATKDQILSSAVSLLELQHRVETMGEVSWISRNWIQWHPLAVVLAELCVRTSGPLVARSWAIVDAVYDDWAEKVADTKHGALWRPMRKLMERARRVHNRPSPSVSSRTGSVASVSPQVPNAASPGSAAQLRQHAQSQPHSRPGQQPQATSQPQTQQQHPQQQQNAAYPQAQAPTQTQMQPQQNRMQSGSISLDTSVGDLHSTSIAMALDPSLGTPRTASHQLAGFAADLPDFNDGDIPMSAVNWEDWDTFFANGGSYGEQYAQ